MSRSSITRTSASQTLQALRKEYYTCFFCRNARLPSRPFTTTARRAGEQRDRDDPFTSRLRAALGKTKIEWKPIPIGLGISLLGVIQFYRIRQRERRRQEDEEEEAKRREEEKENDDGGERRPPKRKRVRPSGPWFVQTRKTGSDHFLIFHRQVQIMSTLPLKAVSRIWGRFNELQIPYYLRVPGFKLYSWIFGVKYTSTI